MIFPYNVLFYVEIETKMEFYYIPACLQYFIMTNA